MATPAESRGDILCSLGDYGNSLCTIAHCQYGDAAQQDYLQELLQCEYSKDQHTQWTLATIMASMLFKHEAFSYEDEERIAIIASKSVLRNIEYVGAKPRIAIDFIEDIPSLIKKVRISPHGDKGRIKNLVEVFKRKRDLTFEVLDSGLPFNGH